MTLRTSDLPGIKHRVLRWAPHAEVLSPPGLRSEFCQILTDALRLYAAR
jgi:predicted DNA-binding transcriptional regulator YafY